MEVWRTLINNPTASTIPSTTHGNISQERLWNISNQVIHCKSSLKLAHWHNIIIFRYYLSTTLWKISHKCHKNMDKCRANSHITELWETMRSMRFWFLCLGYKPKTLLNSLLYNVRMKILYANSIVKCKNAL